MKFPAARIEKDFAWAPDHPVVDAYRAYMKMPYDRQTWDLTAVLYAVGPTAATSISPPPAGLPRTMQDGPAFAPTPRGSIGIWY